MQGIIAESGQREELKVVELKRRNVLKPNRFKVVERWPFIERADREPREQVIDTPQDALSVPWLAEKGKLSLIADKYVMADIGRRGQFHVATIEHADV